MASTRVVMQQLCLPLDCDKHGVCLGGTVLGWVDICAGLASKVVARGPCVTASVDSVHFLRPVRVNTIVIVEALVTWCGMAFLLHSDSAVATRKKHPCATKLFRAPVSQHGRITICTDQQH